tara:strand:- start:444 stop:614 length:171 start_codon:yes stop_codon:yes gene_type:complete
MPTVTYSCPDSGKMKKQTFPYNAVGKAQAAEFSKTMGGKKVDNPGYGMEKKMGSSY